MDAIRKVVKTPFHRSSKHESESLFVVTFTTCGSVPVSALYGPKIASPARQNFDPAH